MELVLRHLAAGNNRQRRFKDVFIIVCYWNGLTILNHCNYDDSGHAVKRFGFAGDNDREPTIDGTSDDHGALQDLGSGD